MINRIVQIVVGIGIIIVGIVIYPHYVEHIIEPLQTLITSMFPGMNVWESTFIQAVPLLVLGLIIFAGIMRMVGHGGSDITGGDA